MIDLIPIQSDTGCCFVLPYTKKALITTALVIIKLLGLCCIAIGLSALGTRLGWWSSHGLSHLGQPLTISLITIGGVVQLILPLLRLVGCISENITEKIAEQNFKKGLYRWCGHEAGSIWKADNHRKASYSKIFNSYKHKETELDLNRCYLGQIPPEMSMLTNLTDLDLGTNYLENVPSEITSLTGLRNLSLEGNQLKSFVIKEGQFIQLEYLNLNINQLNARSGIGSIKHLSNLKVLNLGGNSLGYSPSEEFNWGNVSYTQEARWDNFPTEICQLVHLEELVLYANEFTFVSSEIGKLRNLKILNLNSNRLSCIPSTIGQLTHLEKLWLDNNRITSIPPEIEQLTQLKALNLALNRLSSIPPEIGQLIQLEELCLNDNADALTSVPPEIGRLVNLKRLDLRSNSLTSLPNEIVQLNRNLNISIENNPLSRSVIERLQETMNQPGYQGPRIFYSIVERPQTQNCTLIELLDRLAKAAEQPKIELKNLLPRKKRLELWLSRLSYISGYNEKKDLARLVYKSIQEAEANSAFREDFLACIKGAAATCGDRMALSLLYMGVQYEISQVLKTDNLAQLAYLLGHGVWALSELEKIAGNKAKTLNFVDEIEVYLAYPVKLRDALHLPIAINSMLYFHFSEVKPEDLKAAEQIVSGFLSNLESYGGFLAGNGTWEKALKQHKPVEFAQIVEKRGANDDYVAADKQFKADLVSLTLGVLKEAGLPPLLAAAESTATV